MTKKRIFRIADNETVIVGTALGDFTGRIVSIFADGNGFGINLPAAPLGIQNISISFESLPIVNETRAAAAALGSAKTAAKTAAARANGAKGGRPKKTQ